LGTDEVRPLPILENGPGSLALTPREYETLALLVNGKSNKEIAKALDISVRTVDAYRARLMLKFNVHCVVELVNSAYRRKVMSLPQ